MLYRSCRNDDSQCSLEPAAILVDIFQDPPVFISNRPPGTDPYKKTSLFSRVLRQKKRSSDASSFVLPTFPL